MLRLVKVKPRHVKLAQMKENQRHNGLRNMSSLFICGAARDVFPHIAARLGIVSLKGLLSTCKDLRVFMKDDAFWRQMLTVRFEFSPLVTAPIVDPYVKYLQVYYSGYKLADEADLDFKEWAMPSLWNYYFAISKAKLVVAPPQRTVGQGVSSELLHMGFWHSSAERLVAILDVLKPTQYWWAEQYIHGYLALPAERRKVVMLAMIQHLNFKEDASFGRELQEKAKGKVYDNVVDLMMENFIPISPYAKYPAVVAWLDILDMQNRLEVSGGKLLRSGPPRPFGGVLM